MFFISDLLENLFFDSLYFVPLAYLSVYFGHSFIGVKKVSVFFTLLYISMGVFIMAVRHVKKKTGILLGSLLVELVIVLTLLQKSGTRLDYLKNNIWALWLFLAMVVLYVIVELIHRYAGVKIGLAVAFIAGLVLALIFDYKLPKLVVLVTFFVILLLTVEIVQYFWKKQGDKNPKLHLVLISPFLIAVFVISLICKTPDEPYDWYFFRKMYADAVTFFDRSSLVLFHGFGDSYEHARVGFSENGGILYGMVSNKPSDIMEVNPFLLNKNYVYLAGKHYDSFDGKRWTRTDETTDNSSVLDVIETYSAVNSQKPLSMDDYMRRADLQIAYRYFNSRYVFIPLKTMTSKVGSFELKTTFRGDDLISDTMVNYNDGYQLYYYRLNQDHERFLTLVNQAENKPINQELWDNIVGKLIHFMEDRTPYSYENYLTYKQAIYDTCLQTPEISERTMEWLNEVIEEAEAETDYEKLLALEEAFSDWTYTDAPGTYPDEISTDAEWLDHFLFESREGYCSYYATAFVILSRAMGIPSRYVQGFVFEAEAKVVTVESGMAHAWPEVYLENFGWIRMEPTPGKKITVAWTPQDEIEKKKDYEPEEKVEPKDEPVDIPPELLDDEPEEEVKEKLDPKMILIPAGALVCTALIAFLLYMLRLKKNFDNADNETKLLIIHRRNRMLLGELDAELQPGETLRELRQRTAETLPPETLEYFEIMERVLYGGEKVTVKSVIRAERSNEEIFSELKKRKGIRCYLPWFKSILMH